MLLHNKKIEEKNTGLTFDEKEHLYFFNGKLLNRSISSISNISNKDIKIHNLNEYAQFGTAVHEVIERWAKGKEQKDYGTNESTHITITTSKKIIKFTNQQRDKLIKNCEKLFYGGTIVLSEAQILDRRREAVGTADFGIQKNNELILIDFKTSSKLMLNHIVQLNLYKRTLKVNYGINYDKLKIVKIDRETMELTPYGITDVSETIWQSLPDGVEKRGVMSDFWRKKNK